MKRRNSEGNRDFPLGLRGYLAFIPSWRVGVASRIRELEEELARVPADRQHLPAYLAVRQRLDDALSVLAGERLGQGTTRDSHADVRHANFRIDRAGAAWMSIHRADEQLILVASDAWVKARADRVAARLSAEPLDSSDISGPRYRDFLADFGKGHNAATSSGFTEEDRTDLSFVLRRLNRRSEVAEEKVRSFRNVLVGLQLALILLLLGIAFAAARAPASWSLCGPEPGGGATLCIDGSRSPKPFDVALVELMGALGGLLSAIFFIARLDSFPNPHGLQLVQGLLKVPAGAALALVMTLLVQRGTLEVVASQPGTRVLPLAALLGFAQQAVTTALDQRARGLLGETRAAEGRSDSAERASQPGQTRSSWP